MPENPPRADALSQVCPGFEPFARVERDIARIAPSTRELAPMERGS